ncbi:hypothetical protein [Chryseobacterium defluvii]|nr:hypothetical protein [Chryseobacterium defluvii]
MMKTIFHSDMRLNFAGWIKKWNDGIATQDDFETKIMLLEKLQRGFAIITKLLEDNDKKIMIKARGNLIPGSNEANEKEVMALLENQKKPWYKNLESVRNDLNYIRHVLDNIYEIKNRRSYECFQLRAENHKLRAEIERLRNEKK